MVEAEAEEFCSAAVCYALRDRAAVKQMLLELRAENYAVIDQAVAEFGPGLNLLTGETGAGKSILIDALALLLGGKASSDVVRHGAEKAVLGCVFESTPGAEAILDANGIDAGGRTRFCCGGRLRASGKGRVFVNNQPATVAVLRELAPELALIHAQGETLGSFDQAQQRMLLDRFGGCRAGGSGRRRLRRGGSCEAKIRGVAGGGAGPAADGGPVEVSGEGD